MMLFVAASYDQERPTNPNNIPPHKFAPHVWKPKHCKICYRTLDEHDAPEVANSARAFDSPWHNLSSREYEQDATLNNESRPNLMANKSPTASATGSDGTANKLGVTAAFAVGSNACMPGGTNLTHSRMSLNLDALRLYGIFFLVSNLSSLVSRLGIQCASGLRIIRTSTTPSPPLTTSCHLWRSFNSSLSCETTKTYEGSIRLSWKDPLLILRILL